ncbi:MAG: tetratricopeptide repeat protein [Candidatus Zixiibacteriota bacterium]
MQENPEEKRGRIPYVSNFIILVLLAIVVSWHFLSGYILPVKLWGIHHLSFFSIWVGLFITTLTLLLFVPGINEFLLKFLERVFLFFKIPFSNLNKWIRLLLVGIFSFSIFWFFRVKLHLLGDGYFRIRDIYQNRFPTAEWLDGLIHLSLYKVFSAVFKFWTPDLTYAVLSCVSGVMFVYLVIYLSQNLGKTALEKVYIGGMILSLGSTQLFFGYVESYTLLQVFLIAYILCVVLYLKGKLSLIWPLIMLAVSCALHISALIFIPSFLYLWWRELKREGQIYFKGFHLVLAGVFCALIVWRIAIVTSSPEGGFHTTPLIPLFPSPENNFTLFSWAHIMEYFNQLLLLSPVGIILFFLFAGKVFKQKDPVIGFLFVASIFSLVFIFLFNSVLGSADWDLRAFPGIFFVLFGSLFFLKEKRGWINLKNLAFLMLWVSFFHIVPWIALNHNSEKSLDHYKLIQLNDPHPQDKTNYNLFKIARVLEMAELYDESERLYKQGIRENPLDVRNYHNLSALYLKINRNDEAESLLTQVLKVHPDYFKGYELLGRIYQKREDYPKALAFYLKSLPENYNDMEFIANICGIYLKLNRLEEFRDFLKGITQKKPNIVAAHRNLAYVYFLLMDYRNAEIEWGETLRLKPNDPHAKAGLELLAEVR